MEPISNTVRHRLAAQQATSEHPEADLLNAYAENVLAAQERDGITAHLARCRTCRDVVLLAMPETQIAPVAAAAGVAPQRRWISRPVVRWLGAATAVLVVGTAIVVKKFEVAPPPAERSQQAVAQVTQPAPSSGIENFWADASASTPSSTPVQNEVAADRRESRRGARVAHNASKSGVVTAKSRRDEAPIAGQPGSTRKADRLDQYAKLQSPPNLTSDSTTSPGSIGGPIRNNIVVAPRSVPPPPPLYNLQVQSQAGSVQVSQLPTNAQNTTQTMSGSNSTINLSNAPAAQMAASSTSPAPARNDQAATIAVMRPPIDAASAESSAAVISRAPGQAAPSTAAAKPAGVVGGGLQSYNAVPNAACAIITDGIRCVQNNHKVEFHHPGANLKVIMSQGDVVWAGGDALERSADGGATWTDVKKPITDTITRISIMPDAVYVGGTAGPLWKTADNGTTWAQASPEPATTQK